MTKSALDLLGDYSELQAALCGAFEKNYKVENKELLIGAPKSGFLSVAGGYWEFEVHGKGVRFQSANTGVVVDVIEGVFRYPESFEGWRLVDYCESNGIESVEFEGGKYDAAEPRQLDALLVEMANRGVLKRNQERQNLFSL